MRRALMLCSAGLVIALAAGAGAADASIYWAHLDYSKAISAQTIGRADISGSLANANFMSTGSWYASATAADSKYLYWMTDANRNIRRANLDGSGANLNFIVNTGTDANAKKSFWNSPGGTPPVRWTGVDWVDQTVLELLS